GVPPRPRTPGKGRMRDNIRAAMIPSAASEHPASPDPAAAPGPGGCGPASLAPLAPVAPLDLSVVVPVYNGAASLPELIARLTPVLDALAMRWEVVLVNDGSRDASWQAVVELARREPRVRGIDLMRNYGQHNALL